MKDKAVAFLAIALIGSLSAPVMASDCYFGVVKSIRVGSDSKDEGNQLEVILGGNGNWIPINDWYNLNDGPGYAHLKLLKMSKLKGLEVTLSDDRPFPSSHCSEINSVTLR